MSDESDGDSWLWSVASEIGTRGGGLMQAAGGVLVAGAGAVAVLIPDPFVATDIAGAAAFGYGTDQAATGLMTAIFGEQQETLLNQGVAAAAQIAGASPEMAQGIADGVEIGADLITPGPPTSTAKIGSKVTSKIDEGLEQVQKHGDDLKKHADDLPNTPPDTPGGVTIEGKPAGAADSAGPIEPYDRRKHYGQSPTKSDRNALGAGPDEVLDHDPPLVQRYYEGDPSIGEKPGMFMTDAERRASAADRSRMSPQPRSESNKQGGEMRAYSQQKKKELGLE